MSKLAKWIRALFLGLWTLLTAGGVLFAALVLVLIGTGFLREQTPEADAASVIRIFVGIFGGLLVAVAIWANLLVNNLKARADTLEAAFAFIRSQVSRSGDKALRGRDEMKPWADALRNRRSLKMVGMSLRAFTRDHLSSVREVLKAGGTCQFIQLMPNSPASALAAKTYNKLMDPADYDREILASTDRLRALAREFPKKVTLKYLPHIPIAGITMFEGGDSSSRIIAELYTMDESSHSRPHLDLTPESNEQWFEYFRKELDKLDSVAVKINN